MLVTDTVGFVQASCSRCHMMTVILFNSIAVQYAHSAPLQKTTSCLLFTVHKLERERKTEKITRSGTCTLYFYVMVSVKMVCSIFFHSLYTLKSQGSASSLLMLVTHCQHDDIHSSRSCAPTCVPLNDVWWLNNINMRYRCDETNMHCMSSFFSSYSTISLSAS